MGKIFLKKNVQQNCVMTQDSEYELKCELNKNYLNQKKDLQKPSIKRKCKVFNQTMNVINVSQLLRHKLGQTECEVSGEEESHTMIQENRKVIQEKGGEGIEDLEDLK